MNIQELGVIAQENLPVKIIILNNSHLGMVRQWQELFFDQRYSFAQLKNPDFVKIAEGYAIAAQRVVEKRENLNAALDALLNAKEPYLLEVVWKNKKMFFQWFPLVLRLSEIRLS